MTIRFAFIGFGEAGQAIAAGLKAAGAGPVAAFDILFPQAAGAPLREAAGRAGVTVAADHAGAVAGADIVVSAVTAREALTALRQCAPHLVAGQIYMDINSTSPMTKREEEALAAATGADYVEAAAMATVPGHGHRVPFLLAGRRAAALEAMLRPFGMNVTAMGERVGQASATKMFRSVMVKGIEALFIECLLGAEREGVAERVLASLQESYPGLDWKWMADYHTSRVALHARRRADEMAEAAETLAAAGVAPLVTEGTARRLDWCASLEPRARFPTGVPEDWRAIIAVFRAAESAPPGAPRDAAPRGTAGTRKA